MKTLLNNKGSVLIEYLIGFFCIMLCLAFALSILPVFQTKTKLDNAADTLLRTAELQGKTSIEMKVEELKAETGLDFTVSWAGTQYMGSTQNVQLNQDIHLLLTKQHDISFFTFGGFSVTLKARVSGASERYWK